MKKNNNNTSSIKEFLGVKNPTVVYGDVDKEFRNKIDSINGYLFKNSPAVIADSLDINNFMVTGIDPGGARIIIEDTTYYPVDFVGRYLSINKKSPELAKWLSPYRDFNNQSLYNEYLSAVYISPLSRPNSKYVLDKLEKIFTSEYEGLLHIKYGGRYVFCIDALPIGLLQNILEKVKSRALPNIDLTWVAPLQDIVEEQLDRMAKNAKQAKTSKRSSVSKKRVEIEGTPGQYIVLDKSEEHYQEEDQYADDAPIEKPREGGFLSPRATTTSYWVDLGTAPTTQKAVKKTRKGLLANIGTDTIITTFAEADHQRKIKMMQEILKQKTWI